MIKNNSANYVKPSNRERNALSPNSVRVKSDWFNSHKSERGREEKEGYMESLKEKENGDEKHQHFSQLKMSLITQSLTLSPIEPREWGEGNLSNAQNKGCFFSENSSLITTKSQIFLSSRQLVKFVLRRKCNKENIARIANAVQVTIWL